MIIPIGVDCGMANIIKKYDLRSYSFPFDWIVSYNGVSRCIKDDFKLFIPTDKLNEYDMFFPHDFTSSIKEDTEKYKRRIDRFNTILQTSLETIYFIRKGHASHLHKEHAGRFTTIKSDIEDAIELDAIFKIKYPQLSYRLIVFVVCGRCFDRSVNYNCDTIIVVNIATPEADDEFLEKKFVDMFITNKII